MTTTTDIDGLIAELNFTDLIALQARVTELVQQRRTEEMARLEAAAELIGATIVDGNGHKPKRRRNSKHHEAS